MNKKRRLILFALLMILSSLVSLYSEERVIIIHAKRFEFSPNIIKVKKNETIVFQLIAEDVTHGFYLDGFGKQTSARPGSDGSIKFTADKTGRFTFRCSVTCGDFHPNMVGYLIVEPNIKFWVFASLIILLGSIFTVTKIIGYKEKNKNG